MYNAGKSRSFDDWDKEEVQIAPNVVVFIFYGVPVY